MSLLALYQARVQAGTLKPDAAEETALKVLDALAARLDGYKPRGWFGRVRQAPQGLYLHGEVGRGKSMLMDLFFEQVRVAPKRRVHFHAFMLEVHDRLHRMQGQGKPLPRLARELAAQAWLLCFDEFHVGNIADAMILGRLFEALFAEGVVIVATSNWPPDALYKGGLQRERFLPFIALLKQRMAVHHLAGEVDHRLEGRRNRRNYIVVEDGGGSMIMRRIFDELTHQAQPEQMEIPVQGRAVQVPCAAKGVALFSFDELCARPLGSADYLALASCFHTILISGIPRLTPELCNEASRFTNLIDALYEAKTQLFAAAATSADELCPSGDQAFAFQRTASRLMEMQTEEYRRLPHFGSRFPVENS